MASASRPARQGARSDGVRNVDERVVDVEPFRDQLPEPAHPEDLGRVMAGGDEVDAAFAGVAHRVLGRLAGDESVEAVCGRISDVRGRSAGDDPHRVDALGPLVEDQRLATEHRGDPRHEPFGAFKGVPIGRAGTFPGDGIPAGELFERVREVTARAPTVFDAGPERVRRIGIVSGSAADMLPGAIALGLDAFLTGEPKEHVMADAREAGIHFIAAGHYATETFGIRALGDWLADRFGVEHVWVDIPNPV